MAYVYLNRRLLLMPVSTGRQGSRINVEPIRATTLFFSPTYLIHSYIFLLQCIIMSFDKKLSRRVVIHVN